VKTGLDVLDFYRRNEGIGEPYGTNANWITDWYFGYRSAYNYWCAAGLSRGLVEAGWSDDGDTMNLGAFGIWQSTDKGWGYVPALAAAFRDAGRLMVIDGDTGADLSSIPPGSPIIFNYSGGWRDPDYGTPGDHTGDYLSNNDDGTIQTWEANDRANSIGEWRRDLSQVYAFCLLPEEAPAAPAAPGKPKKRIPVPRLALAGLRVSDAEADQIITHESVQTVLYNDPAGHCTFGIGHLVHLGWCDGRPEESRFQREWTEEEVRALFRDEDLARFERYVRGAVTVPLYQSEFDAAVSYAFNLGEGNVDDTAFLARLNEGNYEAAASELGTWPPHPRVEGLWTDADWSHLPGLFTRREEEAALFRADWGRFVTVDERHHLTVLEEDNMRQELRKRPNAKKPIYDLAKALPHGFTGVPGVVLTTNIIAMKETPSEGDVDVTFLGPGVGGEVHKVVHAGQMAEVQPTGIGAVAVFATDGTRLYVEYEQLAGLPA
jgi:lysozyme